MVNEKYTDDIFYEYINTFTGICLHIVKIIQNVQLQVN